MQNKLLNSPYYFFIQNIISTRGQWNPPTDYWEGHHIIPKCLGGEGYPRNKHSNIIWLTAAEHFTAHKLLVELFPDNDKLSYAFWAMCTVSNSSGFATPEDYSNAKEARSKTIGQKTRLKLIGETASTEVRLNHSKAQAGEANGFYGKVHSSKTRQQLSESASKPVRHLNTGIEYPSSYAAAKALGINRVLINNCCRGKQQSTSGGMKFEYVNQEDFNKGIPGKTVLTRYERRRNILQLRKLIIHLDIKFFNVLPAEDKIRIAKIATCESYRYLMNLLKIFLQVEDSTQIKQDLSDYVIDDIQNEMSKSLRDELINLLREL